MEDADLLTATERTLAGESYLLAHGVETRGSLRLEDWTPVATVHAGGRLLLTDANVGVSAVLYCIMEISKTFHGSGRQDWTIHNGAPRTFGDAGHRSSAVGYLGLCPMLPPRRQAKLDTGSSVVGLALDQTAIASPERSLKARLDPAASALALDTCTEAVFGLVKSSSAFFRSLLP